MQTKTENLSVSNTKYIRILRYKMVKFMSKVQWQCSATNVLHAPHHRHQHHECRQPQHCNTSIWCDVKLHSECQWRINFARISFSRGEMHLIVMILSRVRLVNSLMYFCELLELVRIISSIVFASLQSVRKCVQFAILFVVCCLLLAFVYFIIFSLHSRYWI